MISPTHERPQRSAAEVFTDRQKAKAQFAAALDAPQGAKEYRVLVWCGVGGQGKTWLLGAFERMLNERRDLAKGLWAKPPGFALVNFGNPDNLSIPNALLSIRLQLAATAQLHFFPAFDTAFARYFLLTQPGKNIRALHPELFSTGSDLLDDILGLANSLGELGGTIHGLPGFNLLTKHGTRLVGKLARQFHEWWQHRGRGILYGIDELTQDGLGRKLPAYLGADLVYALANRRTPRLVIMFDTYEALWSGRGLKYGQGALLFDDWVRLLAQDSPGVLFVVTGRDDLRWGEIDDAWNHVIERHFLGGLTRPDAELFLDKWQITGPEISARMIDGAKNDEFGEVDQADATAEAYLPYYLELQVETYWDMISAGRTPTPADFGGDHPLILTLSEPSR
jgi:hypothetical protein